jgi:hypothetical protein
MARTPHAARSSHSLQPADRLLRLKAMKYRIALLFTAVLLLPATSLASSPERQVSGNRLISKSSPAVTIEVPAAARYLGAERWDLYDIADCELHLFVEADESRQVKRLYWIQFEGYLPTNTHIYDYSDDQPVTFAGLPFRQRTHVGPTNNTPRAGSDGERVRQMLARAGYRLAPEAMNVRLVHLLDDANRQELMFIYGEDLALSGKTLAQLKDGEAFRPAWKEVERGLVERAMSRIKLHDSQETPGRGQ